MTEIKLTPQQMVVMSHIVEGMTNEEIATTMVLSISTVKMYVGGILKKYGLSNRYQLIAKFYKTKLSALSQPNQIAS